jgi:serine/threonine protein kinase
MKRVGHYELGDLLGEGSYGKVRQAIDLNTRDEYAIKILEKRMIKQDDLIENLRKEILLMKNI